MITTPQQKNLLLKRLAMLRERVDTPAKAGVPVHIADMGRAQLLDSIADLEGELEEYETACNADIRELSFETYSEMLKMPIVLRLASRKSVAAFAESVGISESQLKRYEAAEYTNAPAKVLDAILSTYNLHISGRASRVGD